MKAFLNRIHARVGDLWWYSAMIFLACRSGDAIQAFIGLWLVPKYVGPQELGAVLPLQQLTSFLTVPLAVVAVVFSKYVNTYATRGEYGKVKSFIHDVFTCSLVLFIICIAGAYLIMPFFYERLRIASGSLTLLILICGLVGNLASIIGAAQQGLKRFKTMAVMNFLSAPIRLVTLLVAMPFRALSGYILGQTTPGATTSILSLFDIHHTLKSHSPDRSWRKDLPEIWHYLLSIAIYTACGTLISTINATIYRQRLPEIESAAYYLITRFAEIASYLGSSMMIVLVPLASEAHESGREDTRILQKTIYTAIGSSFVMSAIFTLCAKPLFALDTTWTSYQPYAHLLPAQTIVAGVCSAMGAITAYELACRRFAASTFSICFSLLVTGTLVCLTGYQFFRGILPDGIVDLMAQAHLADLSNLTWFGIITAVMQMIGLLWIMHKRRDPLPAPPDLSQTT